MSVADAEPFPAEPACARRRWAGVLCVALLVGLGLLTALRWLGFDTGQEKVVQQQITSADFPPEKPVLSAPDPGDTP